METAVKVSEKPAYPCLMRNKMVHDGSNFIIMFTSRGRGMVVHSDDPTGIVGTFSNDLNMDYYEHFHGEVILKS